jgi:hypothetical protein
MQIKNFQAFVMLMMFLAPGELVAQAIGEYGRTVGGSRQRQGSAESQSVKTHLRTPR